MEAERLACDLSSYESATALLTAIQGGAQFHILLLDVMMDGLDRMELAAARYLAKPLQTEQLREALLYCYKTFCEKKGILLPTTKGQRRIPPSDILYVEALERVTKLALADRLEEVTLKFSEVANSTLGASIGGSIREGGSDGGSGTFTTGTSGSAFIMASSIADQSKSSDWSGVIFEGTEDGKVYGSPALKVDAEISADKTLKIEADQTLTVGQDVKLTNNGTVTGMIENGITTHTGKTEWSSNNSQHWHPCAVEGCTAHKFVPAAHL